MVTRADPAIANIQDSKAKGTSLHWIGKCPPNVFKQRGVRDRYRLEYFFLDHQPGSDHGLQTKTMN